MKKLLMIFWLIFGIAIATNANTVEAKAKAMTKGQVAKKAAACAEKAYKTKKSINFTVKIKSSENNVNKNVDELRKLTGKVQLGKYAAGKYDFNKNGTVEYQVSRKDIPKDRAEQTYKGILTLKCYATYMKSILTSDMEMQYLEVAQLLFVTL